MSAPRGESADVRIGLTGVGGERQFVIQNLGSVPATDVELEIEPEAGRTSPLVAAEAAERLPIARLAARDVVVLKAIITSGTGLRFRARLGWRNPDGTRAEQVVTLAV